MKQTHKLLLGLTTLLMLACSGSSLYQGDWKVTDTDGNKSTISFDANKFYFTDNNGEQEEFEYNQNSVVIENGIRTYGIRLADGRNFYINFPLANDTTRAVISDANDNLIYVMGRNEYLVYDDIFKLK
ncbi:MAG: hypothetical protein MI922_14155 [Bacteroidales bacterium]|nr:hypothetical protein [Bacteroidales bacterium]